ncbi:uncharacterized protein LOC125212101 [Salvia hispanica]|uniref:uncharacterized protein LOC125212101 n=1 Tax=Salvia hispanica TaxID=49212 RepID=UPI002009377E|nr:uncharacterized protein LOC125212101 [Salvia hispanica]
MARRPRPDQRSASTGVPLLSSLVSPSLGQPLPNLGSAFIQRRAGPSSRRLPPPPLHTRRSHRRRHPPSTERDREKRIEKKINFVVARRTATGTPPDSRRSSVDVAGQNLRLEDHDLKKKDGISGSHYSSLYRYRNM